MRIVNKGIDYKASSELLSLMKESLCCATLLEKEVT